MVTKKREKMQTHISIEEQSKRITEAIKLFLQVFGFLSVILSLVYAGMEFYIETVQNDKDLKKEIVVKGEEIKSMNDALKENFKEHQQIKEKMVEIHSDVKLIRTLLEVKKVKDHKGLASFNLSKEIYQSVD
jgi:septal ring factor EnvC (AmiA/AmiB activator)